MTANFKDLETRGYLVIKNFLSSDELESCLAGYRRTKELSLANGNPNKNYNVIEDQAPHPLAEKLTSLLGEVRSHTDIKTDYVLPTADYFDTDLVTFGWHQDHEPYYHYQDNYNVLNIWIPLIKPCETESGLKLVPYDKFRELCADIVDSRFIGKGAKSFKPISMTNTTLVEDDSLGEVFMLPFNIEDIAEAPKLKPGDLLLNRCDVLHASQPGETARVSFNVRCLNLSGRVYRDKLYNSCQAQQKMMKNNESAYRTAFDFFENTDREYITIAQLVKMDTTRFKRKIHVTANT
jgi:hypothetical protein